MAITLTNITSDSRLAVEQLLQYAGLPTSDLPEGLPNFIGAFENEKLVGIAGFEQFGMIGLLRSVAVRPGFQHQQLGGTLIQIIEQQATALGIETLFLITTTAEGYFDGKGFFRVERSTVPDVIASTQQFSGLCPSSAVVMRKNLS